VPWILDGNNLAGGQDRENVRRAALALARAERVRLVVFFDGAPPAGAPAIEHLGPVEIRYVPNADRAILELLGNRGRGWRVATDDRGLRVRVRDTGAEIVPAAEVWAKMEAAGPGEDERRPRPGELSAGYREGVEPLVGGAMRVPRRRRPKAGR
jgi:hypothetical protein